MPTCEPTEDHGWSVSKADYKKVFKRLSSLPFQYYREVYKPVTTEHEESVTRDLWEDLTENMLILFLGKEPGN